MTMSSRVVNICYETVYKGIIIYTLVACKQSVRVTLDITTNEKKNKQKRKEKNVSINKICEFPFSKFLIASFLVEDWKLKCSIVKFLIARQTFSRLFTIDNNFSKSVKNTGIKI